MERYVTFSEFSELRRENTEQFTNVGKRLSKVEIRLSDVEVRLSHVEEKLDRVQERVDSGFDFLFDAYKGLKEEQIFTNQALKRIEEKLGI